MISRRMLLRSTALLALVPSACASLTGSGTNSRLMIDLEALNTGLTTLLATLTALKVDSHVLNAVQQGLATVKTALVALQGVMTSASTQQVVQNVVSALQVILTVAGVVMPGLPQAAQLALAAVAALIPFIQSLAGIKSPVAAHIPHAMTGAGTRVVFPRMTPAQARCVLNGGTLSGP